MRATGPEGPLAAIARRLARAEVSVCLTGAGVSAESGIPTFRDVATGLWSRFDPEQLASVDGFRNNPNLVWCWYRDRVRAVQDAQPNPGHVALARLARILGGFTTITQNVDDLHERAGSADVVHLHGRLTVYRCLECGTPVQLDLAQRLAAEPPVCAACAGLIRPGVVWFGELLDANLWEQAYAACQQAQVMLVVGTSGLVWPAAELPLLARRAGAHIVEVNPEDTELTGWADTCVRGRSGEILPLLADQVERMVS